MVSAQPDTRVFHETHKIGLLGGFSPPKKLKNTEGSRNCFLLAGAQIATREDNPSLKCFALILFFITIIII